MRVIRALGGSLIILSLTAAVASADTVTFQGYNLNGTVSNYTGSFNWNGLSAHTVAALTKALDKKCEETAPNGRVCEVKIPIPTANVSGNFTSGTGSMTFDNATFCDCKDKPKPESRPSEDDAMVDMLVELLS